MSSKFGFHLKFSASSCAFRRDLNSPTPESGNGGNRRVFATGSDLFLGFIRGERGGLLGLEKGRVFLEREKQNKKRG